MQNRKSLVQIASQCQGFAILQPFRNAQSRITGNLRFCMARTGRTIAADWHSSILRVRADIAVYYFEFEKTLTLAG